MKNEMEIIFDAVSDNEGFARVAVAAFIANLNPTLEEMADIKTAVSEAVTNCIIHGYGRIAALHETDVQEKPSGQGGKAMQGGPDTEAAGSAAQQEKVRIHCVLEKDVLHIEVIDTGKGIEDVEQAMEPLFTTRPELERSGMGFAFMEAFMDELEVESTPGEGTTVRMMKKIGTSGF